MTLLPIAACLWWIVGSLGSIGFMLGMPFKPELLIGYTVVSITMLITFIYVGLWIHRPAWNKHMKQMFQLETEISSNAKFQKIHRWISTTTALIFILPTLTHLLQFGLLWLVSYQLILLFIGIIILILYTKRVPGMRTLIEVVLVVLLIHNIFGIIDNSIRGYLSTDFSVQGIIIILSGGALWMNGTDRMVCYYKSRINQG